MHVKTGLCSANYIILRKWKRVPYASHAFYDEHFFPNSTIHIQQSRIIISSLKVIAAMPHSVSPESSPIKNEPMSDMAIGDSGADDIHMQDATSDAVEAKKETVNLEGMFDKESSDDEFPSSPPKAKVEVGSSPEPA
jgi:hypothetical protein